MITFILTAWRFFSSSKVGQTLGLILGALAGAFGIFLAGRRSQLKDTKARETEAHLKTLKEINRVSPSPDRQSALDRLRRNKSQR